VGFIPSPKPGKKAAAVLIDRESDRQAHLRVSINYENFLALLRSVLRDKPSNGCLPYSAFEVNICYNFHRRALSGGVPRLTSTAARDKLRPRAKRPPQFGVGLAGSLGDVLQLIDKIPARCGRRKLFSVVFIELYDLSDNVAEFFEDGHLVVAVASA
jgi:hypothetical protein